MQEDCKNVLAYAVKHKNMGVRMASRSGGIFTALSDYVLEQGGIIYGCSLNEKFLAVHKRAQNKLERDSFRESKYIQSDLNGIFQNVCEDLKASKYVLFSGTSCQTEGLKKYLQVLKCDISKLVLVDIVCHGVPSPKVWSDYLQYVNEMHPGKIEKVSFRNKQKYGWKDHVETVTIDGSDYDSRVFTKLFYDHNILRPSCYVCPYKNVNHTSDITIADCWGIDKNMPDFTDNKGVSLVMLNTDKGKQLFENVSQQIEKVPCDIKDYLQPPLQYPFPEPSERKRFWKYYFSHSFKKVAYKYVEKRNNSFSKRVIRKINRIIERLRNGKR